MNLGKTIDEIANNASKNISVKNGDYLNDDGLWVCGKCNTPKQVRIEILGQIRTPMCLCKCEAEKRDKEEAERKQREFMLNIERMRRTGFPDTEMEKWTFERDDKTNEKLSTIAENYVNNFNQMYSDGKGLLLFGPVGTGKTFISACIANALIDKGRPCLVTNFARLINTISGMFEGKQDYLDSLNRFDLIVIDDFAAERDTEYMGETVFNIIDARYRSGKPLIVTTNLTSEELKNPSETRKQRIYSRLFEMCIPIHVEGKDRRKNKLKEDFHKYDDLLGL